MSEPLKVILVDDEREACDNLKHILAAYVETPIEIIGVFNNTRTAEAGIARLKPDAIFIDIEMPGENAFGFLERQTSIDYEVIFVTAYDEYAIRAFRINALDYILKPISIDEVRRAAAKLQAKLADRRKLLAANEYQGLAADYAGRKTVDYLRLRSSNSLEIVRFIDILFVEAMGNYCNIHYLDGSTERNMIMSHSVSYYEDLLPKDNFFRIHKSFLASTAFIRRTAADGTSGGYMAVLTNGRELPVSRRRYESLIIFLKTGKVL